MDHTTRDDFKAFLKETDFPSPDRIGERGPTFKYPEWLIMFIAVLSVKMKLKAYVQIHKKRLSGLFGQETGVYKWEYALDTKNLY